MYKWISKNGQLGGEKCTFEGQKVYSGKFTFNEYEDINVECIKCWKSTEFVQIFSRIDFILKEKKIDYSFMANKVGVDKVELIEYFTLK